MKKGLEILATVAMERMQSGKARMHARFTVPDPALTEERVRAEEPLSALETELEMATKTLSGPDSSLKHLNEVMKKPMDLLSIKSKLTLNWMNVLVDSRLSSEGHEVSLAEFSLLEGKIRRCEVFVSFSLDA